MLGPAGVALAVDLLLGEPPAELHPTIWMGRWLAAGRSRRRSRAPIASLLEGSLLLAGGAMLAGALARATESVAAARTTARGHALVRGAALSPALSLRALLEAAREVQCALERGRVERARRALAWHLVSRDTRGLSGSEVAGAAIESVAENLGDSIVAPLLAFRSGGLAAAYIYRMVNTADAMLGYRTPELEWFGKPAARTDDLLNIAPARIAALLICSLASAGDGSPAAALRVMVTDARETSSPNAGWPMAAMAGALGVALRKREHYSLNVRGRAPVAADIGRSCRIVLAAALLAAALVDLR